MNDDEVTEWVARYATEKMKRYADSVLYAPKGTDDCGATSPHSGFICTRAPHRKGPHVATGVSKNRAGLCSIFGTQEQFTEMEDVPRFTSVAQADAWLEGQTR